jgi:hypothetical protein
MTPRDLRCRLDALAKTLRLISRSTTRPGRSVTVDAQQLVDLEGAAAFRSLRALRQQIKEEPQWVPCTGGR